MHVPVRIAGIALVALMVIATARAQEARFANGMPLKGEITGANNEGLEVKIANTTKTFPWETLSPATRYRYQIFYRANFNQVLLGISSGNWSNEPDQVYRPFGGGKKIADAGTAAPDSRPATGSTLTFNHYEAVPVMAPADIPKVDLRATDLAQYWSVQYGPSRKDVAVFVFDAKGAGELPDMMYVRTFADDRTEKMRGAKRTDKNDIYMEFRTVPLQSLFGSTKATFEVECWFAAKTPGLQVKSDVELSSGDSLSTFTLRGTPAGMVQGNAQIATRELLAPPTLWFVLDTSSGKPLLVGNIRMGKMKLVPGKGMDSKLRVEVLNSVNGVAMNQEINMGSVDSEAKYMVIVDLGKLAQNETYTIKASIDLGLFLGKVAFEDKITIPKLGKK
jgi:hypothetical protein